MFCLVCLGAWLHRRAYNKMDIVLGIGIASVFFVITNIIAVKLFLREYENSFKQLNEDLKDWELFK